MPPLLARGLSLVELMIALALGLLLIAAVGTVYLGGNRTYRAEQDAAQIQDAGRYALDVIGRALRQAGYANTSSSQAAAVVPFAGTAIKRVSAACPSAFTIQYDGISGDKDCQAETIAAGEIVQQTFFIGEDRGEDRYTPVPALRCDAVRGSTPWFPPGNCPAADAGAALLRNVEDLQILYGIDTNTDQSADRYDAGNGVSDWSQVVSVRVCILVRSETPGSAPSGQTHFNCAGALGTAADEAARFTTVTTDTRLRRAFVGTFTLRNRISAIP
ncbi:PilW family protein [uncultured Thiodictyon sp.]|uniref:PilW family protein n=2 Tax=uncultured Thiodictyon sp. TaxID=1846217 RepID=UPI00260081F4|nr:PilW family protein [uncultured Thiodictyon sp.]